MTPSPLTSASKDADADSPKYNPTETKSNMLT